MSTEVPEQSNLLDGPPQFVYDLNSVRLEVERQFRMRIPEDDPAWLSAAMCAAIIGQAWDQLMVGAVGLLDAQRKSFGEGIGGATKDHVKAIHGAMGAVRRQTEVDSLAMLTANRTLLAAEIGQIRDVVQEEMQRLEATAKGFSAGVTTARWKLVAVSLLFGCLLLFTGILLGRMV